MRNLFSIFRCKKSSREAAVKKNEEGKTLSKLQRRLVGLNQLKELTRKTESLFKKTKESILLAEAEFKETFTKIAEKKIVEANEKMTLGEAHLNTASTSYSEVEKSMFIYRDSLKLIKMI